MKGEICRDCSGVRRSARECGDNTIGRQGSRPKQLSLHYTALHGTTQEPPFPLFPSDSLRFCGGFLFAGAEIVEKVLKRSGRGGRFVLKSGGCGKKNSVKIIL